MSLRPSYPSSIIPLSITFPCPHSSHYLTANSPQLPLYKAPRLSHFRPQHHPLLPPQHLLRHRPRNRLPRLANSAGTPLPRAKNLVRTAQLRHRGAPVPHPAAREARRALPLPAPDATRPVRRADRPGLCADGPHRAAERVGEGPAVPVHHARRSPGSWARGVFE